MGSGTSRFAREKMYSEKHIWAVPSDLHITCTCIKRWCSCSTARPRSAPLRACRAMGRSIREERRRRHHGRSSSVGVGPRSVGKPKGTPCYEVLLELVVRVAAAHHSERVAWCKREPLHGSMSTVWPLSSSLDVPMWMPMAAAARWGASQDHTAGRAAMPAAASSVASASGAREAGALTSEGRRRSGTAKEERIERGSCYFFL